MIAIIRKLPGLAIWMLGFLIFLSVFRDLLANGRPLYCQIDGISYYPGLRSIFTEENSPYKSEALRNLQLQVNQFEVWKNPRNFDKPPVYAPVPFSPGEYSTLHVNSFSKPGQKQSGVPDRFVHFLGTDASGRDILATLISGARIALLTGTLAMAVALLIGMSLGLIAGFFGDDQIRIYWLDMTLALIGIPIAWFYAVSARAYVLSHAPDKGELLKSVGIFMAILLIVNMFSRLIRRINLFKRKVDFPADLLIMRLAELFSAIPSLILIIVLAVALRDVMQESIWLMIALIGALGWTGVTKLVRAELLKVRALDYVTAAKGLGISEWRVLLKHALPNTLRPIYSAVAFGAANAVLLESYLSFLGYGGSSFRGISWGSLFINENSSSNPLNTWWVTLFPGLMIFITVYSLNRIGDALADQP